MWMRKRFSLFYAATFAIVDLFAGKMHAALWNLAKNDVAVFIADKRKLDLWSAPFFHDLIAHLRAVDA